MASRALSRIARTFTTSSPSLLPRSKPQPTPFACAKRFGNYEILVPPSVCPTPVALIPRRGVPEHIARPDYAETGKPTEWSGEIYINDELDVEGVRKACGLARKILWMAGELCKPGATTDHIDRALHDVIVGENAYPSPLNYMGFPRSVCTSVNNIIAHGIPNSRPLKNGDIINVDVTVYLGGYHGDTSATFLVGDADAQGRDLVECTKESLQRAIDVCGPGVELREIGRTIRWVCVDVRCSGRNLSSAGLFDRESVWDSPFDGWFVN
ncbi:peptidase M24, structural domain-containing protein [Jimgerdemannia flammicorona]|uniref:Peptidase M24, structural domain-containing protein n=1 Tax=Jimgerdemannia flammicorona TaxID=994334 RepID=A0A433Q3M0_9FUNG|nr:peptidase M24, structural domain-containing protein [Jimgerdemannia flammicorona]